MSLRRYALLFVQVAAGILLAAALPARAGSIPTTEPLRHGRLDCFNAAGIETIRTDPRLVSRAYASCRAELKQRLGTSFEGLGEEHLQAAFATIVANRLAPYGQSSAFALGALLKAPQLDCDNYAALAGYLVRRLPSARAGQLRFVGFDDGPIGNHAQVFYRFGGREILLDPTVGLVALASYEGLMRREPVAPAAIADFYRHGDPAIEQFKRRVAGALIAGDYRAEQRIYVAQGHDNFLSFGRACARGGSGKRYLTYSAPQLRELCRRAAATPAANQ